LIISADQVFAPCRNCLPRERITTGDQRNGRAKNKKGLLKNRFTLSTS